MSSRFSLYDDVLKLAFPDRSSYLLVSFLLFIFLPRPFRESKRFRDDILTKVVSNRTRGEICCRECSR
jgi:hypothetical protein